MSTAVRLYLRIRRPDGSRLYADPVFAGNCRLRPLFAMLDGQPRHCPDGVYYLRYAQSGKRVWQNVGADPQLAQLARDKRQRLIAARNAGVEIVDDEAKPKTLLLATAIVSYIEDTGFTRAPKTVIAYAETLRGLAENTARKYLEGLERRDVLGYMAYLRRRGSVPRTVYNRLIFLRTFFLAHKLKLPLEKGDWPKYTDKVVACYRHDQLKALLAAANQDEADMIHFFLCTGGRKQEVQFAGWSDIDWVSRTLTITERFRPGLQPQGSRGGSDTAPRLLDRDPQGSSCPISKDAADLRTGRRED